MLSDKEQKKEFKLIAQKEPGKYYPVQTLKELGFQRKQCQKCKTYFWTVNPGQTACGDPACCGGFAFIGNSPAKNKMDYIETWQNFSRIFKKLGYTPIPRYPVVARWRADTDFVQASIYDFQPYVVSGEVEPPANPLVVPQFSLRFNDIDNVGITGAHYTGFVMIGQHAFMPPDKWDQPKYFNDIYTWLKDGLGLPNEEITFHEDAWAGGGNFGPCVEFFSRGLELGNQVYMLFEQAPSGNKELKLKVLDMGMGHERNSWFASGTITSYESTFPTVMRLLHKKTGVSAQEELMKRFMPYSSCLNVDEAENIGKSWDTVASRLGMDAGELKGKIAELSALYSVAEHSRSLLVALSDGALPSNVGGGYNLRVILRRALSFIDKYKWDISMQELCEEHARYLKPLFPELMENLDSVNRILEVEKEKFMHTKQKSAAIVSNMVSKGDINEEKLLELYDSNGISPEMVKAEAEKQGVKVNVPENFYAKVAELHEKKEQEHATGKSLSINLDDVPETKAMYCDDYALTEFKAKVLKVEGKHVVLDATAFYPTSGGQVHDVGEIAGEEVVDVVKEAGHIVHVMASEPKFKEGDEVEGKLDKERRKQLAQHHTSTHIVNAAARRVLGKHINQAGAKKAVDKAHLDITHYQSLTDYELKAIEKEANRIVDEAIDVKCMLLPRNEAEKKYGMAIYQGGAVPGKMIRVVDIKGVDVEACGGTHLKNTSEVGEIKIIKSTKVQDGVVRIVFTAGKACEKESGNEKCLLEEAAKVLGVKLEEVPSRARELFEKWKRANKDRKKNRKSDPDTFVLKERLAESLPAEDLLKLTASIFKTQPEHVPRTAKRFLDELMGMKE
ncbi:MAG: alanine--tRNA ligase [Candidatus Woesearchaeota archaeon]